VGDSRGSRILSRLPLADCANYAAKCAAPNPNRLQVVYALSNHNNKSKRRCQPAAASKPTKTTGTTMESRAEQVPFGFLPRWKSFKFIVSCISRPALLISRRRFWHYPWPIFRHHLAGKLLKKRILNFLF